MTFNFSSYRQMLLNRHLSKWDILQLYWPSLIKVHLKPTVVWDTSNPTLVHGQAIAVAYEPVSLATTNRASNAYTWE